MKQVARDCADYVIECIIGLAYFIFVTPFHVQSNTKTVTGSQWQKVTSLTLTLITVVSACISTSSSFSRASIRSPAIIFRIAPDIGDTFLEFMFWLVIWRRKSQIEHFFSLVKLKTFETWRLPTATPLSPASQKLNKILPREFAVKANKSSSKREISNNLKVSVALACAVLVSLIVAFDTLKLCARYVKGPPFLNHTKSSPLGVIFEDVREGFFQESRAGKEISGMSNLEIVVAVLYMIFQVYSMFSKAFAILLCFAGVLVVFQNSIDLNEYLKKETDQVKVIQAFESFREYVESINEITGPIMFGIAIICAPTFFVANLSTLFISWTAESPITWLTIWLYTGILWISSEVTSNTDEFREWILECGEGPFEDQLFANFVDLTQNPLGLRGMECFTVTHKFLAQIFSAVVTFTIILLQFQTS